MSEKFIGTFQLTSGEVMVSDPCYKRDTWCQTKLAHVKTGEWNAYVREESGDGRIAELIACHSAEDLFCMENKWEKQPFVIGVDSGQAGFFDERNYRNDATSLDMHDYFGHEEGDRREGDRWYGVCCNLTLSRLGAGVLEGGVVSSTGYGDGGYALYTVEEDGEVVAMKIVFIEDVDDEYDEYDEDEWEDD